MGISRDHLEKIELKLKTERGWREGLTVNSACGPSGDTNFTPPYSPVCCLPAACRSSFRSSWMPPPTSFLKKKKKKQRGHFQQTKGRPRCLSLQGRECRSLHGCAKFGAVSCSFMWFPGKITAQPVWAAPSYYTVQGAASAEPQSWSLLPASISYLLN